MPTRRAAARSTALALAVLAGLAACAPAGSAPGDAATGTWTRPTIPGETPSPVDDVTFEPCPRTPAGPDRTHLRPRTPAPEDATVDVDRFGTIPVDGPLVVEDAGDLVLVDGLLGAGNGAEVMLGGTMSTSVAPATVPAAVSLSVLDSAYSGRRVAFVEARLGDAPPERWEESTDLVIVSDGGDAGYLASAAASGPADVDTAITESIDAANRDGGVCALRRGGDGEVDGVITSIGWGDGWYPVLLGHAEDGTVVSVVMWGLITPWEWSGLPGTPPAGI